MTATGASDFEKVLADEISEIQASRERRLPEVKFPHTGSPDPYAQAHEAQLFGLAFSGGGIRSATFNLGILQALSELGVLRWVDYLSTVSGGGYIGSWLAAWIKRQDPGTAPTPVEAVQDRLAPDQRAHFEAEALNPIHFLRQYSNYLTPRTGFFGADTWTMIAIYLRNVILNQAILMSTLAAVLMVPRFAALPFDAAEDSIVPFWIAAVVLLCAMIFIGWNLVRLERNGGHHKLPFYARQGGIQLLIVLPALVAAYFSSIAMWQFVSQFSGPLPALAESWSTWIIPAGTFAGLMFIASFCGIFRCAVKLRQVPGAIGLALLSSVLPGAFGGVLLWGLAYMFTQLQFGDAGKWHALAWGPPLLVAVFSLVVILHLGLVGLGFPDSGREWWSRLGAWLGIYSLCWAGLVTLAIYGPLLLVLGAKGVAGISLGWAAATIGGLWAGRSPATGSRHTSAALRLIAQLAPYIFIVGLLLAVSLSIHFIVPCLAANDPACDVRQSLFDNWVNLDSGRLTALHFELLSTTPLSILSVTLLALVVSALILAWRVDINEFSMHHFYRNRLVRCYLGASHERQPQGFTGFDPHDDVRLADLAGSDFTGPYPLVNTTLNLVSGEDLGWQQRKGASFVFTPRYCGYQVSDRLGVRGDARRRPKNNGTWPGYRRTPEYAYPENGGISLGTAMAISGAAASPNEGYHSSPATAFLMTVFDVRLGWWLGNPATRKYYRSAPRIALYCLVRELFGLTSYRSNFVYLSDGGHFENLGVYELVRRRCRYIIACDADQDGELGFADLGNLIRKCRTDMGVDIEIDVESIRRQESAGLSKWHCAIGAIRYDTLGEGATPGTLVYIKSSLTGDEASDVLSYRQQELAFPHQSTADQWFDESQFESYRKLGYHAARTTFEVVDEHQPMQNGVENFFVALRQSWYPPSSAAAAFTKHAATLDRLMERLRKQDMLHFLDAQLCPEWKWLNADVTSPPAVNLWLPTNPDELRSGFYFCNSLIQLMESVYLDLKLDQEHDHPDNRGWMNLFKHCAWSGMFRATWAISASSYGARFQTFCRRLLGLETGDVEVIAFTAEKEDHLNFHEAQLLREFLRTNDRTSGPDQTQLLQVVVRDASNPSPADAGTLRFTFGISVVQDGKVVLFRVQDHLRKMGLAREALRKLVHEQGVSSFEKTRLVRYLAATQPRSDGGPRTDLTNRPESSESQHGQPPCPEVVAELMEMAHHENLDRFEQLFRSVQREPREKRMGAKA